MKEYNHRPVWCIYLGNKQYMAFTRDNKAMSVTNMEDAETFLTFEEAEKVNREYWLYGRVTRWFKKDNIKERDSHDENEEW